MRPSEVRRCLRPLSSCSCCRSGKTGRKSSRPTPTPARQLVRDALTSYGVGIFRQRHDQLIEAARCLEEAVRLDPGAVSPRQLLIPLYTALGRPTDAAGVAAAVVVLDPTRIETWRTLARLLHQMKRTGEAIGVLNRCIATPALADRPADRIAAYRDLVRLHMAHGTPRQAAGACRKALALLAENRTAVAAEIGGPADGDLLRAELSDLLAAASLETKDFVAARDAALEARDGFRKANDPARVTDLAPTLAAAYAGLDEFAKAHALLNDYLAGRPHDMAAVALKTRVLRKTVDAPAALAYLTRAAEADADFTPLWVLLGDECRAAGEPRRAEQAYREAVSRNADVAAYRGLFAVLSGRGGSPSAILGIIDAKVRKAIPDRNANGPEDAEAKRQRETALEHTCAISRALRQEPAAAGLALRTAAAEVNRGAGRDYATWLMLADVAEHANQLATAEMLIRRAIASAGPADAGGAYGALVRVLVASRQRQALVSLCLAIVRSKNDLLHRFFYVHLARALAQMGRIDDGAEGRRKSHRFGDRGPDRGRVRHPHLCPDLWRTLRPGRSRMSGPFAEGQAAGRRAARPARAEHRLLGRPPVRKSRRAASARSRTRPG